MIYNSQTSLNVNGSSKDIAQMDSYRRIGTKVSPSKESLLSARRNQDTQRKSNRCSTHDKINIDTNSDNVELEELVDNSSEEGSGPKIKRMPGESK